MTKHRTFKAVGFFVVLAAVLVFLAIPNSQAGAGKRPIRWKASVEPFAGTNLSADQVFVGGVDHVNINNGSGTCAISGSPYSFLELQVFAPSLWFSGMDRNSFSSWGNPDLDDPVPSPYEFPNTSTDWPYCVADFLNNKIHPTADYEHITLRFSTCGCEGSSTDLMGMGVGDILPVRMSFLFFSHTWGCPTNSPFTQKTFLNLLMNAHGFDRGGLPDMYGSTFDIYIKRLPNENGLPLWIQYSIIRLSRIRLTLATLYGAGPRKVGMVSLDNMPHASKDQRRAIERPTSRHIIIPGQKHR